MAERPGSQPLAHEVEEGALEVGETQVVERHAHGGGVFGSHQQAVLAGAGAQLLRELQRVLLALHQVVEDHAAAGRVLRRQLVQAVGSVLADEAKLVGGSEHFGAQRPATREQGQGGVLAAVGRPRLELRGGQRVEVELVGDVDHDALQLLLGEGGGEGGRAFGLRRGQVLSHVLQQRADRHVGRLDGLFGKTLRVLRAQMHQLGRVAVERENQLADAFGVGGAQNHFHERLLQVVRFSLGFQWNAFFVKLQAVSAWLLVAGFQILLFPRIRAVSF